MPWILRILGTTESQNTALQGCYRAQHRSKLLRSLRMLRPSQENRVRSHGAQAVTLNQRFDPIIKIGCHDDCGKRLQLVFLYKLCQQKLLIDASFQAVLNFTMNHLAQ